MITQEAFQHILIDPSAAYEKPEDVVSDKRLTSAQKITILKLWAFDAREIEVAQEENMRGEPSALQHVLEVLHTLKSNT